MEPKPRYLKGSLMLLEFPGTWFLTILWTQGAQGRTLSVVGFEDQKFHPVLWGYLEEACPDNQLVALRRLLIKIMPINQYQRRKCQLPGKKKKKKVEDHILRQTGDEVFCSLWSICINTADLQRDINWKFS